MLAAFSAEGVEYLVVGAHALAAHGHPRATRDLDLWIGAAGRCVWRRRRSGAAGPDGRDLVQADVVFRVGVAPHRIDIVTASTG
jgi:hypothetical protein